MNDCKEEQDCCRDGSTTSDAGWLDNPANIRPATWPYSVREYTARFAWSIVQATLLRQSPPRAYGWRRFWLRLFGARIEPDARVRATAVVMMPWLLEMESGAVLGDRVIAYNLGRLFIGRGAIVSQGSHLCGGTHDYSRPGLPLVRTEIVIEAGAWICADAFIGPGVCVGERTIVGARSAVFKSLPPHSVYGGNPAVFLKPRPRVMLPEVNNAD